MLDERTDEHADGTGVPLAGAADGSSTLPAHEQLVGGVEQMALSLDPPPASLLALPDGVHYALCALLDVRGCLSLRAACLLLRATLTGPDADLGVWKPRVLALAPSTRDGPCTPSGASYERQYAFLHRYAYLVGDYRWPLPVIGGLVRVELHGSETVRATLTTRPRVGVGSRYAREELFRITRGEGLLLPRAGALEAAHGEVGKLAGPDVYRDAPGEGVLQAGGSLRLAELGLAGVPEREQPLPWVQGQLGCPALRPALLGHVRWDDKPPELSVEAVAARVAQELTDRHSGPALALGPAARLARYYYGDYGPHGAELLHLSWGALEPQGPHGPPGFSHSPLDQPLRPGERRLEGIRGLKVCGDPNVPAGQCSFSAWGEVFSASEARLLFPAQGACRCMNAFMCGCLTEHELASGAVTVLGGMRGTAKTAQHGYRSPESHPGRILFYLATPPAADAADPAAAATLPRELRDAGRVPPAVAGASAVHVLLVWDGREFRTSTRLAPIDLQPAED